eukprot:6243025-Pyramimonas_sp.AAC.1
MATLRRLGCPQFPQPHCAHVRQTGSRTPSKPHCEHRTIHVIEPPPDDELDGVGGGGSGSSTGGGVGGAEEGEASRPGSKTNRPRPGAPSTVVRCVLLLQAW